MKTKIKKRGNSLAARIPQAFVKDAHLAYGTPVNLAVFWIVATCILFAATTCCSQSWLPKVNSLPLKLRKGLILSYDFEAGEGNTIKDKGGRGRNAKIHGAEWINADRNPMARLTGKKGGALEFDGGDDYVDCGHGDYLRPDEFTISTWLSPRKEAGNENHLTCFLHGRNGYSSGYRLILTGTSGRYVLQWGVGGKSNGALSLPAGKVGDDVWHHIVVTFGEQTMRLYMNGELKGKRDWARFSFFKKKPHLWIGRAGGGVGPYRGKIRSFRIYDRVLSEKEIADLHKAMK